MNFGGASTAPSTAFVYDGLAIMPARQQLWLNDLQSYKKFPPLQNPDSYDLTQVFHEVKSSGHPED